MTYVGSFGGSDSVILECLINPRNVVSIPSDYNATKMRVCEYYPYAISNGENQEIFLENDYKALDDAEKLKEFAAYEQEKKDLIAKLEAELAEKKQLLGGLL